VGEPFTVELKAMVEQGDPQPGRAEFAPPRGIDLQGQTEQSQTLMQMSGARTTVQVGRVFIWQLAAQKPGRYTLPSPTVEWNGQRLTGRPMTVEVVPSTGQRRQRQPNNPFLMPGGPGFPFPFPFPGGDRDDDVSSEPAPAPELSMRAAPDPGFFVRAIADKKSVVVGQQVTVSIYIYYAPRQRLSTVGSNDAPLSEFLRVPINKSPGTDQPVIATVGGAKFFAKLTDQLAIFPLRAGEIHTGQWRYDFVSGRNRSPITRSSEDQVIHVTEPPRAGRPVGYTIGDVGQFTLTASVAPRRIDEGSELSVTLRLAGTGNLPQSVRLPERTGVEWLEPERRESIEPQNGMVGGWRTFGYVVRVKESGKVDLGEVRLPYWDPAAGRYAEAKAALGTVDVSPRLPALDPRTKQPIDAPPPDPFAALPGPRAALGAYTPLSPGLVGGQALWLVLAAPPLLVGTASAGVRAARKAKARRTLIKRTPAMLAQAALEDARKAEAAGDVGALAAALSRAIHFAVEGATGLRSRGVLVTELPAELDQRGLPAALAEEIAGALAACETVRFDPSGETATRRDLAARVREVVTELGRRKAA
jgi:hypothetical protein